MNRIKELREASGMSQAKLGERIGCVGQTVSKFEKETRQLDPPTICALCDIFGCTADYLIGRTDMPMPVITDRQAEILRAYEALPFAIRTAVDGLLAPYLISAGKKDPSAS